MTTEISSFEELLDTCRPLTLFAGVKRPQGREFDLSYRKFIRKLSDLTVTPEKDGILMSPAQFKNRYRSDENVQELNQLVFDVDDAQGLTFDDLAEMIHVYAGLIHTTHSHTAEAPRYRIVLPLSKSVDAEQWARVREGFLLMNPWLSKIIDPVCKEPSRGFYVWSARPETADIANFFVCMGRPIRPEDFAASYLPRTGDRQPLASHRELSNGGIRQGSRNSSLASYLGGLINRGFSQDQTLAECQRWNETLDPPLEDAELLSTHRSIWARHLRNHPSVGQHFDTAKNVGDEVERFKLIPASKLLDTPPKPREYIIENFIPRRIVAGLFAPGGVGKSTLTLATAASVAAGVELFGAFRVEKPGKVVLVAGEDDCEEIQRRLHRLMGSMSEAQRVLVGRNLHVIDLADAFALFTERPPHGEVSLTDVPEAIATSIESSVGAVDLIIVDPASRFRGGEENGASDTTRFVQALQFLRDRLGASIWMIHHTSKAARGSGAHQNNARGSSALIDGLRLGYELTLLERGEVMKLFGDLVAGRDVLSLRCIKSNYGKAPEPIYLQRNDDGTLSKLDQNPGDTRERKLLEKIHEAGLTKSQFRDRFAGVSGELGLSEKALVRSIEALVSLGLLETPDRTQMRLTEKGRTRLGIESSAGNQRAIE